MRSIPGHPRRLATRRRAQRRSVAARRQIVLPWPPCAARYSRCHSQNSLRIHSSASRPRGRRCDHSARRRHPVIGDHSHKHRRGRCSVGRPRREERDSRGHLQPAGGAGRHAGPGRRVLVLTQSAGPGGRPSPSPATTSALIRDQQDKERGMSNATSVNTRTVVPDWRHKRPWRRCA
jgi:hypothetical protein